MGRRRKADFQGQVEVGLNAVIFAVTAEEPRVLTVRGSLLGLKDPIDADLMALPYGPLDPKEHRTLELALRSWVLQQTGIELGYVEQLYTFGDRFRDSREREGAPRVISVAYLALVREGADTVCPNASWHNLYDFFPWEDWREGKPKIFAESVEKQITRWVEAEKGKKRLERKERSDIAFGLGGASWDAERVLERYELLYEAGLVFEAHNDLWKARGKRGRCPSALQNAFGRPMALDHRRILATALGRLRGKLKYRPVVFELISPTFTLLKLQSTVEALVGLRLHKQNFRRLVERAGLVERTGIYEEKTGGRPAELFRFRREVLRERLAPGVKLPGVPP